MATSTNLISNIFIPLLAMVFSFLGGLDGGYVVWKLNKNESRYQKLYGPLKFNLLMMKLIFENEKEVIDDIKKYFNVKNQGELMMKHLSPLAKRWLNHRDNIKDLFEKNPGLINKEDFDLMSNFIDGCIKREIIEEGKNILAVNKERTDKLLEAIKKLQNKLL